MSFRELAVRAARRPLVVGVPVTSAVRSETPSSRRPLDVIRAYVALTKPRIIELLLVTTVPAMLLAARGLPPVQVVVATLVGGILSAGSANAFNCYFDRDIDAVMRRTRNRPLAKHQVSDRAALVFGFALAVVSTAILWIGTTWLAAVLAVATIAFYVCVYTLLLKRRTSQNIIWGGAAGCMPVMIGWAAVTGSLAWAPVALFAVIFFWTPPHSWALAMRYREDYAAAGVPMLPVVKPARVVTRWMVVHAWLMVASSVALWPLATSWVYGVSAVLFGAWFLVETHLLHAATVRGTQTKPIRVFHLSNTYLTLLFLAVAVDALLGL